MMKHDDIMKKAQVNRASLGISKEFQRQRLLVRYCKEDEVVEKNQIFLLFKSKFLAKIKNINQNG